MALPNNILGSILQPTTPANQKIVVTFDTLTPAVTAWEINQSAGTFTAQISTSGDGSFIRLTYSTDSNGDPTFTIVNGGRGYDVDDTIVVQDAGSTDNQATLTVATIKDILVGAEMQKSDTLDDLDTNKFKIFMERGSGDIKAKINYGDSNKTIDVVDFSESSLAGGGGSGITIKEEGSSLSGLATSLNFVGSNITASGDTSAKTITVTGGGGTSYWMPQWFWSGRTQFDHWYMMDKTRGWNYYNINEDGSQTTTLPTIWGGTYCSPLVVLKNCTLKEWGMQGTPKYNATDPSEDETFEFALMKGVIDPAFGEDNNYTLTQIGTTQDIDDWAYGDQARINESGLSVSLNASEVLFACYRRATNNTSDSHYLLMNWHIIAEIT